LLDKEERERENLSGTTGEGIRRVASCACQGGRCKHSQDGLLEMHDKVFNALDKVLQLLLVFSGILVISDRKKLKSAGF
jgi:hypothetical protein